MDLQSLINSVTVLAAAATVVAVQILKSPLIPPKFQNEPVATTIVVSAIATFIALWTENFSFAWVNWTDVVAEFVTVLLVAAATYNHVIANWPAAKSLEASKVPKQ